MLISLISVIICDIFLNAEVSSELFLDTSKYLADGAHMSLQIRCKAKQL